MPRDRPRGYNELSIPCYLAKGFDDPGFLDWKRDHPQWFVAGTWTRPQTRQSEQRERAMEAVRTTVGVRAPAAPFDPSTLSVSDFMNVSAQAKQEKISRKGPTTSPEAPSRSAQHASEERRTDAPAGYSTPAASPAGSLFHLPDSSLVPDTHAAQPSNASPTDYLMTPHPEGAADVAAAGRAAGETYYAMMEMAPWSADGLAELAANQTFVANLGRALGHGGKFDYQREGNHLSGFTQYRQFRHISNFNVGLYAQQSGMTLDETLRVAGAFATIAGTTDPNAPYRLESENTEIIRIGFQAGESGMYGPPARPQRR